MVKRRIAVITYGVLTFVASFFDIWLYVELFSEDSKSLLLYKLHIDYSKIYPSFISIVLSLEKLY